MKSVVVFCSASDKVRSEYLKLAEQTGRRLAQECYRVVYGGGRYGLMGKLAQGALAAGGEVVGVIPEALKDVELALEGLTELHIVKNMHERKQLMADFSQAVIALPGGYGTLDEVIEMITWKQLGFHDKPIYFLNYQNFWAPLLDFFKHLRKEKFIHGNGHYFKVAADLEEIIEEIIKDLQV